MLIQFLLALKLNQVTLKDDVTFASYCNAHAHFQATFSEKRCALESCRYGNCESMANLSIMILPVDVMGADKVLKPRNGLKQE